MGLRRLIAVALGVVLTSCAVQAQSSSSSSKHVKKPAAGSPLDAGALRDGVYRNAAFGFACKVPPGWVLRTEEMNAGDDTAEAGQEQSQGNAGGKRDSRVLLAAFSRPPEARGEDVNSSIVIAAESAAAYPGLKEAAQYFEPLTEVAKAQGFTVDEEPYETAIGAKRLVRSDFHKDVGTRVMRQSTLAMLARGYAVSFTFIDGTEDGMEELVEGLSFGAGSSNASSRSDAEGRR